MPVKTISVRLTFVTSVRVNQQMASNDFILSSGSDTEVSEMEDYELEVEGSPNSSFAASDEEDTHEAYADDPLADLFSASGPDHQRIGWCSPPL